MKLQFIPQRIVHTIAYGISLCIMSVFCFISNSWIVELAMGYITYYSTCVNSDHYTHDFHLCMYTCIFLFNSGDINIVTH